MLKQYFVIGSITFLMSCLLDLAVAVVVILPLARTKTYICIVVILIFLQSVMHFSYTLTMILDLIQVVMLITLWICIRKNNCTTIPCQWCNLSTSLWASMWNGNLAIANVVCLYFLTPHFCTLQIGRSAGFNLGEAYSSYRPQQQQQQQHAPAVSSGVSFASVNNQDLHGSELFPSSHSAYHPQVWKFSPVNSFLLCHLEGLHCLKWIWL